MVRTARRGLNGWLCLVSTWWNTGKVVTTVSNSTQTLEAGCHSQDIPARILLVRNGKVAHLKSDCPFLPMSHAIHSLSWCSQCDPTDAFEKRDWRRQSAVLIPCSIRMSDRSLVHSPDTACCTDLDARFARVSARKAQNATAPPLVYHLF